MRIPRACRSVWILAALGWIFLPGCGSEEELKPSRRTRAEAVTPSPQGTDRLSGAAADGTHQSAAPRRQTEQPAEAPDEPGPSTPHTFPAPATPGEALPLQRRDGTLPFLAPPPPNFDPVRVAAAGLRQLQSKHLTLYTDLPADEQVDALPSLFDQAVPQWARYFGVAEGRIEDWHIQGYLMRDREAFRSLGMLPPHREGVRHGLAVGHQVWMNEQPTAYYRRHLLLHEGTHAFMYTQLGSCGPGWYMEGMAELLATHRLEDGMLKLNIMPQSREEVPLLGRVKLVQDAAAAGRVLPIGSIMQIDNRRALENESYAWSWALTKLLDTHPRYRERFRKLPQSVRRPDFDRLFRKLYEDDWTELATEWHVFATSLEHGHDIRRTAIQFVKGVAVADGQEDRQISIRADRGWQSSGVLLEQGQTYQIRARGRYQLDDQPEIWWCEPGGVTLKYHEGRPLGMLLGAILSTDATQLNPIAIGLERSISCERSGTLYLKVNESPGQLANNQGALTVQITSAD